MTTYFLFGKYTPEALRKASAQRTQKAYQIIQRLGGKIRAVYALLGSTDLLIQVELPGTKQAIQASLALTRLTGIGFSTSEAIPVNEFDKLVS